MSSGRTGFTTGTCAAAAAKAATMALCGRPLPSEVNITLPDGSIVKIPIVSVDGGENGFEACVRKDAGDDPDVTDGCSIKAMVQWMDNHDVIFRAGEGVGTVTKPGLSVPPGEPAVNPTPRRMIRTAIREITDRSVVVTISIPGGEELALKTFNPRLGIDGGLSILGTSGIVRPFSSAALQDALKCALNVAVSCEVKFPVFVPGRIGDKAVKKLFRTKDEQVIEVSNEWGFMLDLAAEIDFKGLLVLGHPGKLAKLMAGWWDTHSSRSPSAVPEVLRLAEQVLDSRPSESITVEGIFRDLSTAERKKLADSLSAEIRNKVYERLKRRFEVQVALVSMTGDLLGQAGDTTPWS